MTKNHTILDWLEDSEDKDSEISFLRAEVERLQESNTRLRLDAVKEMTEELPEIKETFREWLRFDDRDLYEEAMDEIEGEPI